MIELIAFGMAVWTVVLMVGLGRIWRHAARCADALERLAPTPRPKPMPKWDGAFARDVTKSPGKPQTP
jgi:hypothetical protein